MKRFINALRHPLGQSVVLIVGSFVVFKYIVPLLPGSAPVPQSLLVQYTLIALIGVLLFVSTDEETWARFKKPIHDTLVDDDKRVIRGAFLTAIPLLVGFVAYNQAKPSVGAAAQLRSIHPAPPSRITFQGRSIEIEGLANPLRAEGAREEHVRAGREIYYKNCMPCHGDLLDGQGHFAPALNPTPLAFDEAGTIDQLQESFLFWRIAKGGLGLPREGTPWNSAMPVWEDFLTEREMWQVIIFLYEQAGLEPRTWEEGGEHE